MFSSTLNERTPLKQDAKKQDSEQPNSFCTFRWLFTVFLACASLAILGCVMQKTRHDRQAKNSLKHRISDHLDQPKVTSSPTKPPTFPVSASDFLKCNPSVALSEAVSVSTSGAFLKGNVKPFADGGCGAEQAAIIRQAMQQANYDFQAVDPKNGMSPSNILQTLLTLSYQDLNRALGDFTSMAAAEGNVGALVKLFAWGIPIRNDELLALVGEGTVAALLQCNVLSRCGSSPLSTSSVQLLPIPGTKLVVATDWAIQSSVDKPVPAIDENTLFLADNIPVTSGTAKSQTVLDMGSSSGVLGLIAAVKGANTVHMMQPNLRALQFAQFSTWLNNMQHKVVMTQGVPQIAENTYEDNVREKFNLVLGQHVENGNKKDRYIKDTIESSHNLLADDGALILGFAGQSCDKFDKAWHPYSCGDAINGDLSGNVVCKSQHEAPGPSAVGIMYAWKVPEQPIGSQTQCGQFETSKLPFVDGLERGARACAYAKPGMFCGPHPRAASSIRPEELVAAAERVAARAASSIRREEPKLVAAAEKVAAAVVSELTVAAPLQLLHEDADAAVAAAEKVVAAPLHRLHQDVAAAEKVVAAPLERLHQDISSEAAKARAAMAPPAKATPAKAKPTLAQQLEQRIDA